ncbi:2-hydroxyacid dehydrogenase [Ideonella sp.]|uniref:2-hydroxyacid dehydrogenase n=1 Tax=Ideonella sp. TaxID=1929293 RepID=UPI003BB6B72A
MSSSPRPAPRLLQTGPLVPSLAEPLNARYTVERLFDHPDPLTWLRAEGARFDGIACSAGLGFSADLLPLLPALQVVSSYGVGLDKIPQDALRARGIPLATTGGVLDDCVADAAWALLMALGRRVVEADAYVRSGQWAQDGLNQFPLGRRISGARLGVVGLGRIGQVVARRAAGFDMRVAYHSRRPVAGVPWRHEPDLCALARDSDFLVLITAGGEATRHLVNAPVLEALGPRGYLINVARGSVVDEAALLQALASGQIAGAGLDVFDNEPAISAAMRAAPRTLLMPHIASATEETRQAMAQRVIDNLDAWFERGELVSPAL